MTQLQPATPDTTSLSGFAAMFEASETTAGVEIGGEGQIVSGTVVQMHHDSVIVDIGGEREGGLSKKGVGGARGPVAVKSGGKGGGLLPKAGGARGRYPPSPRKGDKRK